MNVRIYKPTKTAMQSGRAHCDDWVIEYELDTARAPEPLMGWIASGDTMNQPKLRFDSQEEAIAFAQGKGWTYTLIPARARKVKPRNYGDNFVYRAPATGDKAPKPVEVKRPAKPKPLKKAAAKTAKKAAAKTSAKKATKTVKKTTTKVAAKKPAKKTEKKTGKKITKATKSAPKAAAKKTKTKSKAKKTTAKPTKKAKK